MVGAHARGSPPRARPRRRGRRRSRAPGARRKRPSLQVRLGRPGHHQASNLSRIATANGLSDQVTDNSMERSVVTHRGILQVVRSGACKKSCLGVAEGTNDVFDQSPHMLFESVLTRRVLIALLTIPTELVPERLEAVLLAQCTHRWKSLETVDDLPRQSLEPLLCVVADHPKVVDVGVAIPAQRIIDQPSHLEVPILAPRLLKPVPTGIGSRRPSWLG